MPPFSAGRPLPTTVSLSRRRLLGAGLAAGAAGILGNLSACSSGTASQAGSAAGGLTIGLTYTPNIQFGPFYLAASRGQYAPDVKLRHHGAQEGLFDALAAGTEQVVIAGGDEAAVAASNGSDLVVIGGCYQKYPVCVIVPESSPITDLAGLRGRSVGLPGRYGENWFALELAMDTAGLAEDDLDIQEIGFTQQAALIGGKVEAIVGFSNNDAVQIGLAGTPVRLIPIAEQIPLLGVSIITSRAVLDQHRTELIDLVTASAAGMTAFVNEPDAAVEATKAYLPDLADATEAAKAREVAVSTGELIRPSEKTVIGALVQEHVGDMIDFLSGHNLLGEVAITSDDICDPLLTVS